MKQASRRIGAHWYFAIALALALYLYFMLPATATFFYELHHLAGIDSIYQGYSIFKVAGYYFGTWPYRLVACSGIAVLTVAVPALLRIGFNRRSHI